MPLDPSRRVAERIYRQVDIRIHADAKVMKLSKPPPSGKGLWYELLFGEQTGIIPGLFKIGEAGFAEQLEWPLKDFRRCWQEILDAELMVKADWKARLVWVPNAIHHNSPRNPKQILHWRKTWQLLPACALKQEAQLYLEQYLKQFKGSFGQSFAIVTGIQAAVGIGYQEAVSSKQGDVDSSQSGESEGREFTGCESVDDSLSPSDRAQVQRMLASGQPSAAAALLASLRKRPEAPR